MKEYSSKNIRNVALVSHSGSGKTILTEAFLHFTGATTRMGKIEEGNTVSDFDEEEVRRTISLYSTVIPVEYKDTKINLLDTPGYTDFVGEMISALSVADSAMIVVDSVSGFEVGTELAWNYCNKFELPRFVVINKMDRENADYKKAFDSVQNNSEARLLALQIPIGEKQDFQGVVDLLNMKAFKAGTKTGEEIPADLKAEAEEARTTLVEAAAEGDDTLLEKYLEGGELTSEEIARGLAEVVQSGSFIPVLVAAGSAEIGIAPLLDSLSCSSCPPRCKANPSPHRAKQAKKSSRPTTPAPRPCMFGRPLPILSWASKPISASTPARSVPIRACGIPTKKLKNALAVFTSRAARKPSLSAPFIPATSALFPSFPKQPPATRCAIKRTR